MMCSQAMTLMRGWWRCHSEPSPSVALRVDSCFLGSVASSAVATGIISPCHWAVGILQRILAAPIALRESIQMRPCAEWDVHDPLDLQIELPPHAKCDETRTAGLLQGCSFGQGPTPAGMGLLRRLPFQSDQIARAFWGTPFWQMRGDFASGAVGHHNLYCSDHSNTR